MTPNRINYRTYQNRRGTIHKKVTDITEDGRVTYEIVYKKGKTVTVGAVNTCWVQTFAVWANREVKS